MVKLNPMSRPTPLTPVQAAVLSAALPRQDGAIVLPARLKGQAASALGASLIAKGLAREVRAKPDLPAWRQDNETGKSYALLLTKAGRVAPPAPEATAPAEAGQGTVPMTTAPVVVDGRRRGTATSQAASGQTAVEAPAAADGQQPQAASVVGTAPPRPDSKLSGVIGLLEREGGVTIHELIAATGWLPHTTRAALTRLRKRGFAVTTERQAGAATTYRIPSAQTGQAA